MPFNTDLSTIPDELLLDILSVCTIQLALVLERVRYSIQVLAS